MLVVVWLCVVIALVIFVNNTQPSNDNPINLTKAENLKGYMLQSKRMWNESENGIKSVAVIRDESNLLEVKVVYLYSGEEGIEVSTCGGVHEDLEKYNDKWSCSPTRLQKGEHSATLRFKLIDRLSTNNKECSQAIALSFYKHGSSDFYKDYYIYNKAWLKNESGLLGRLKQLFHLKMSCT